MEFNEVLLEEARICLSEKRSKTEDLIYQIEEYRSFFERCYRFNDAHNKAMLQFEKIVRESPKSEVELMGVWRAMGAEDDSLKFVCKELNDVLCTMSISKKGKVTLQTKKTKEYFNVKDLINENISYHLESKNLNDLKPFYKKIALEQFFEAEEVERMFEEKERKDKQIELIRSYHKCKDDIEKESKKISKLQDIKGVLEKEIKLRRYDSQENYEMYLNTLQNDIKIIRNKKFEGGKPVIKVGNKSYVMDSFMRNYAEYKKELKLKDNNIIEKWLKLSKEYRWDMDKIWAHDQREAFAERQKNSHSR